ncbi:hypothetical protein [Aquirufa aurantiipilula]|uniref:hypothetical protein n=1 Tax=Aquirufa aurantiipilula TaxID=2696561 RepID=UPI001CAA64B1|nr:hypothetical protein [Aquirufa aurantiipilula]MBZ1325617.1 hypothetical protein [Aquirufa aurantiipilula]
MSSDQMKQILGTREYYEARDILMDTNDPVILTDDSYQVNGKCMSFWLADKYNTGEIEYKSLPEDSKMVAKIMKYQSNYKDGMDMMKKYDFLINQFTQYQLSFNPLVYVYVTNMYHVLMSRVINNNPYQIKVIQNLIGRWLYLINKVDTGDLNPMVSGKNHRLNSVYTHLPKILRPFILCNGRPLVGLDVKSSAPYLLATVMNDEFIKATGDGYNLKTIYPEMYDRLYNRGMLDEFWNTGNDIPVSSTGYTSSDYVVTGTGYTSLDNVVTSTGTSSNNLINVNSSNTGNNNQIINYYINNNKGIDKEYSSFMWCLFFNTKELRSIKEYQELPFEDDYYAYVVKKYSDMDMTPEELQSQRESFKKSTMYILFDGDKKQRNNNPMVRYMNECFPGVNKWLEYSHETIGGKELSYILQRTESYFMLNKVSRRFNQEYPQAPLFTIHDGLYTFEEFVDPLKELIINEGKRLTGIVPGVKRECPRIEVNPTQQDIDKCWKKVKWITNKKQFEKKKRMVFQSNIDRCKNYFKPPINQKSGSD